ncbi:MAG: SanA protein [Ruminococcaceae bacterium]|nr:SanA protein [Oscillospiraceae bacterium]
MKNTIKKPSKTRKILTVLLLLAVLGCLTVSGLDLFVVKSTEKRILPAKELSGHAFDCALVLGAGVKENGRLSDMLADRMDTAIALYKDGRVPKLLLSGDHGREDYDEVNAMRAYALERGVPSSDMFTDHAGFSTYESVYRARDVFAVEKAVIVTQEYHLHRALYIAESLGVEAVGVSADLHTYRGQPIRDGREVLARVKDVFSCLFAVKPTYLGGIIPVSGNGEASLG